MHKKLFILDIIMIIRYIYPEHNLLNNLKLTISASSNHYNKNSVFLNFEIIKLQ